MGNSARAKPESEQVSQVRNTELRSRNWPAVICCALFLAVFLTYQPVWKATLIWNDIDYVTDPALQNAKGLFRIWFEPGATEQYYPVLHSAFWLQHKIVGDSAPAYHLINIGLHALAACLFYFVLRRLSLRPAWLPAILFALHPVCVESVAWISEQKNTLSLCLYLAAALGWLRYRETCLLRHYGVATLWFILAILSKSVTATLPAALLVIAWWKNGRLEFRKDVAPLLPWFFAGASVGLFTAWVEFSIIGASGGSFTLSFLERGLLAGRVICFYVGKLCWPVEIVFFYPRWQMNAFNWLQYTPLLAVTVALIVSYLTRKRTRAPLAVCLLFAGGLFPVLGFFNIYAFNFSYVADHFQYLPALVVFTAIGTGFQKISSRSGKHLSAAVVLAVCLLLSFKSCSLAASYKNLHVFYRTILERNPDAWMAHANLGNLLLQEGNLPEALGHLLDARRLQPGHPDIETSLGVAYTRLGQREEAAAAFKQALRQSPGNLATNYSYANFLLAEGNLDEALVHLQRALALEIRAVEINEKIGSILLAKDRFQEALVYFQKTAQLNPARAEAYNNLGLCYAGLHKLDESLASFDRALELNPTSADILVNKGLTQAKNDRIQDAIAAMERALTLQPDNIEACENLVALLESEGRFAESARYKSKLARPPSQRRLP